MNEQVNRGSKETTMTPEQWEAIGRFRQDLSARLDLAWNLQLLNFGADAPSIYVTVHVSGDHDDLVDKAIEGAFNRAGVPGYEYDGVGVHQTAPNVYRRDLAFCARAA